MPPGVPVVVLLGGGVESTFLVKHFLAKENHVQPIHVQGDLCWEDCESVFVRRFCEANACERLLPLVEIHYPQQEVLPFHWAVNARNIPLAGDTTGSLEIPLRNLSLLTIAAARFADLPELNLVMGTTADNAFSDGSREFFDQCVNLLSLGVHKPVTILTPLIRVDKTEVIRQADRETLSLSFSCIDPRDNQHCGRCCKCGSRQAAFARAGVSDPTEYANRR